MRLAAFAAVFGLVTWAGLASADETGQPKPIVLKPVQVVGHRPFLTIEVARVPHSLALQPIRERFVNRIEKPVQNDPF